MSHDTSGARRGLRIIPRVERAAHAVARFVGARSDVDVTQAEAHVLAYLSVQKQASINEIHQEFGHRRSTLTSVLDRLEKRRVLRRELGVDDRRTIVVSLTAEGIALSKKVLAILKSVEAATLEGVSDRDVAGFVRVVDALTEVAAGEVSRG